MLREQYNLAALLDRFDHYVQGLPNSAMRFAGWAEVVIPALVKEVSELRDMVAECDMWRKRAKVSEAHNKRVVRQRNEIAKLNQDYSQSIDILVDMHERALCRDCAHDEHICELHNDNQ